MAEQVVLHATADYPELGAWLADVEASSVMLVCDGSIRYTDFDAWFDALEGSSGVKVVRFSDFKPNPSYESAAGGVDVFCKNCCDTIIAVGGGSAMDVAKCIKLWLPETRQTPADEKFNYRTGVYLDADPTPNDVPFLVIPTTAGTGSEATRYAVVYYEGKKQSVTSESFIPSAVLFDPTVLATLPDYQRRSTMLDALCHSVESFWSVNSTDESKTYAREAISLILGNYVAYLQADPSTFPAMQRAAYLAGRAINITQTTAGHAMCYKLTSLYGIAHGHAASLCDCVLWPYMVEHTEGCADPRGSEFLARTFVELAEVFCREDAMAGAKRFAGFVESLGLKVPVPAEDDYEILRTSVNLVRLKNNPVALDERAIDALYHKMLDK